MVKGIFFDLGGTLFSYRNVPRTTMGLLVEVCERLDVAPDKAEIKIASNKAGEMAARKYASLDYYLHSDYFLDNLHFFAAHFDRECPAHLSQWYLDTHRQAIIECLELKDDCIDTLKHLREQGLYLSIVSNIDDDMLLPLLERGKLAPWFDHCSSSEMAQSCKPHRAFFDFALDQSGLNAEAVLFVGDSLQHDIAGANAAGMKTVLIADGGMPPPMLTGAHSVEPDITIDKLSELSSVVVR